MSIRKEIAHYDVVANIGQSRINIILLMALTTLSWFKESGRVVTTPYLGMALVFWGFGRFQVSETAIKQTKN